MWPVADSSRPFSTWNSSHVGHVNDSECVVVLHVFYMTLLVIDVIGHTTSKLHLCHLKCSVNWIPRNSIPWVVELWEDICGSSSNIEGIIPISLVYMYSYVYTYIYIYIYIHVYIYIYIHMYIHIISVCLCVYIYIEIHMIQWIGYSEYVQEKHVF